MAVAYLAMVERGEVKIKEFEHVVPPCYTLFVGVTPGEAVQNLLDRLRKRANTTINYLNSVQCEHRIVLRHLKRIENDELQACVSVA